MASPPEHGLTGWQQVGGNAAELYERQLVPAMFAPWAPHLLDLAGVRTGAHVLDVACGTGVVTRLAAARVGRTGRCVGLDINAGMLGVARSLPPVARPSVVDPSVAEPPIAWLQASALAIPLAAEHYDVVLCQQGLQQFPDRLGALREMRRVLRRGGRLAVSVWSQLTGSPGMAALVDALERHVGTAAANNRRAPFALGDADALRRLLAGAGFTHIELHTRVETARFPSPEALVAAQLAATPLSTLGTLTDAVRQAVAHDVRTALEPYLRDGAFAVPMEAHIVLADQ
jgi:ubiquinone/menaquinone biosynthesis C-methylase UbiE